MSTEMIKVLNGVKLFTDHGEVEERLRLTKEIAENCNAFQMDVEDEIIYEDIVTCYNCRYRRWHSEGFTCYKGFPAI